MLLAPVVDARVPIYYEEVEQDREEQRKKAESVGFNLNWDYFTGMTTYFPSVIYTELPPILNMTFRHLSTDPLMTYRFTAHNPFINAAATINPYTYNVTMNAQTAKKKE
jgi:molybdopterin-containing oxidoreductase family molybdopterin binding subunit